MFLAPPLQVVSSSKESGVIRLGNWNHVVADILWRSLLLRSDNVRGMVVNGNLGSRLIGVVGQALRFSASCQVQGLGRMAMLSAAVASCHLQKLSQDNQCSTMPI